LRPLRYIVLLSAGLALFALAACGGNGDGTGGATSTPDQPSGALVGYFDELARHAGDFEDRGTELEEEYQAGLANSPGEELELTRAFLDDGLALLRDFVARLRSLAPPPEAGEAHQEAVEAGEAAIEQFDQLVSRVAGADSVGEIEALIDDLFAEGGEFDRFSRTCEQLQQIADENGVDIDLRCG
jgi:hypothetical protein